MLQSPPFLPTQTQAQMLQTWGLLFVAKLTKYICKKLTHFGRAHHYIVIIIIVDRQYYLWFLATQLGMRPPILWNSSHILWSGIFASNSGSMKFASGHFEGRGTEHL